MNENGSGILMTRSAEQHVVEEEYNVTNDIAEIND